LIMRSLTSQRERQRPENFQSPAKKDFFNTIRDTADLAAGPADFRF
jgi:hypothetical protein